MINGAFGTGICIMNSQGHYELSKGLIELDYKLVVDNIVHNSNNQYEFGSIMLQQFLNLKRHVNYVTYSLARVSNLYARNLILDLILPFITTILMNEII